MSKSLFGIPINGEPYEEQPPVQQRPISDLEPVFRALLDDPNVHSFGWRQYTPYFNDGDTCEFRVREPWLRTVDDVDRDDLSDCDFEIDSSHPTLGDHDEVRRETTEEEKQAYRDRFKGSGWEGYRSYVPMHTWDHVPRTPKYPETLARAEKLSDIQLYEFEYAMKQAFGDHARVTVTRDGITIDEYDHD